MRLNYILISLVLMLAISCNNTDKGTSDTTNIKLDKPSSRKDLTPEEEQKMKEIKKKQIQEAEQKNNEVKGTKLFRGRDGKIVLPDACSLVTKEQMATWLKVPLENMELIDGSPRGGDSRSCFFKWEDAKMANTAVLIQIMRNSVEDEVPEWPTYFIDSKRETGEQEMTIDGEKAHVFKTYDEFGDDGAYNTNISKWYWRIGNDAIVMIAFNTYFSAEFKSSVVKKIGTELMSKL